VLSTKNFRIGFAKSALAGFQNWWGLCCRLFKRELFVRNIFVGLKIGEISAGRLSKALCSALRKLLFNRIKGYGLAVFQKLCANEYGFGTERLRASLSIIGQL
jgi:hypothetical protein